MKYSYKQKSGWLLNSDITNRIAIDDVKYARLNISRKFTYTQPILNMWRDVYDPSKEKGGLMLFDIEKEVFRSSCIIFVSNIHPSPQTSYRPDPDELSAAYRDALVSNRIPLFFHTHPTIEQNDDFILQSINFLRQLNTSLQDQSSTRWGITYNNIQVRLPELLYVANMKSAFVGMYGGLAAPLCFTEQKQKDLNEGMDRTMDHIYNWADTPQRKGLLALGGITLFLLMLKYPKAALSTAFGAGIIVPPIMMSSMEEHVYFGVTSGRELNIKIPKLSDEEIIGFEKKAIEALKKIKKQS